MLLANGTVGDVLPIVNVAKRLIPNCQCTLITHQEHQVRRAVMSRLSIQHYRISAHFVAF